MNLAIYLQLIILAAVNIIFTLFGIVLNTLVIVSFLRSSQLRKKLCNFTIMLLSCLDLLTVITNHPTLVVYLVLWLNGEKYLLTKVKVYGHFLSILGGFSTCTLLVMNIERYLGVYYPFFHRTSVTRSKLLTLLTIFTILPTTLTAISANDFIIPLSVASIIFLAIYFPPFVFINYKLFRISREVRRNNAVSPLKGTKNVKTISTCLLTVGCFVITSIPGSFYIALNFIKKTSSDSIMLSYLWGHTIFTMNSTFNNLIFFWRNNILRTEGKKVLLTLKLRLFGT